MDPNLHLPGGSEELLCLLLLPRDEASGQHRLHSCKTETADTAARRTCWYELRNTDKKCAAVVCGLHKLPQCLYAERDGGSVSKDDCEELNTAQE